MLDVEKLRRLIEPDLKRGDGGSAAAMIAMIGPLWQDSQRLFVGTDISDKKVGLLALDDCPSDEAASRVEHTTQALLTFALNGLAEARKVDVDGPAGFNRHEEDVRGRRRGTAQTSPGFA